jgi:hypothetical protein
MSTRARSSRASEPPSISAGHEALVASRSHPTALFASGHVDSNIHVSLDTNQEVMARARHDASVGRLVLADGMALALGLDSTLKPGSLRNSVRAASRHSSASPRGHMSRLLRDRASSSPGKPTASCASTRSERRWSHLRGHRRRFRRRDLPDGTKSRSSADGDSIFDLDRREELRVLTAHRKRCRRSPTLRGTKSPAWRWTLGDPVDVATGGVRDPGAQARFSRAWSLPARRVVAGLVVDLGLGSEWRPELGSSCSGHERPSSPGTDRPFTLSPCKRKSRPGPEDIRRKLRGRLGLIPEIRPRSGYMPFRIAPGAEAQVREAAIVAREQPRLPRRSRTIWRAFQIISSPTRTGACLTHGSRESDAS